MQALRALNQIVQDGVIEEYAIGGAWAATMYVNNLTTQDLDVFVFLKPSSGFSLLTLTPIYDALKGQGAVIEGEHVRFGSEIPVQILPDTNALVAEGIKQSAPAEVAGVPTRVFTAEHLCAIALQLGRDKDDRRVRMFVEEAAVSLDALKGIIDRHGLHDQLMDVARRQGLEALLGPIIGQSPTIRR